MHGGVAVPKGNASIGVALGDTPELAAIFADRRAERIFIGKPLFREGDPGEVYQLLRGCLRIYRTARDGRRSILRFAFGPDYFGRISEGMHEVTCEAVSDVEFRRIPSNKFRLALRDPMVARAMHIWSQRALSATQDNLARLATRNATERVAGFLVMLTLEETCRSGSDRYELRLPMSRKDIADYLGLELESVSRAMTRLKEAGYISIFKYYGILIEEPKKLAGVANMAWPLEARR